MTTRGRERDATRRSVGEFRSALQAATGQRLAAAAIANGPGPQVLAAPNAATGAGLSHRQVQVGGGRRRGSAPRREKETIYLLHFDRPYKHARHYTGWAADLDARLAEHARGPGCSAAGGGQSCGHRVAARSHVARRQEP